MNVFYKQKDILIAQLFFLVDLTMSSSANIEKETLQSSF